MHFVNSAQNFRPKSVFFIVLTENQQYNKRKNKNVRGGVS
jgi:hypothetical protein